MLLSAPQVTQSVEMTSAPPEVVQALETATGKYIGKRVSLEKATGQQVSKGKGFLSIVSLYTLKWRPVDGFNDVTDGLPSTVIVKVPNSEIIRNIFKKVAPCEEKNLANLLNEEWISSVHNRECATYAMFSNNPPVPMAICYRHDPRTEESDGMLILENIATNGCHIDDISMGLNLKQLYSVVNAVSDLQLWSLETSINWKETVPSYDDYTKVFTDIPNAERRKVMAIGAEALENIGISINANLMLEIQSAKFMLSKDRYFRKFMPTVFVHGDLWSNNMMFKQTTEGQASSEVAAILDWQLVHSGSIVEDLAHLLSFSVNAEVRKAFQEDVIEQYHARMAGKVQGPFPTVQQVMDAYKIEFIMQTAFLVMGFGVMMNEVLSKDDPDLEIKKSRMIHQLKTNYEEVVELVTGSNIDFLNSCKKEGIVTAA